MRIFAVTAACLMLFVVADTAIVKAASTDPVLSPQGTDNGAGTAPPPVVAPPPPPDEPQRPVEPGTITQGWDNSSPVSSVDKRDVAMVDTANETMYETAYGYFALTKSAPYFLSVLSPDETGTKIADSAFLVMFQGLLLEPKNGRIDKATSSELSFHYELYLAAAREGTMTVDYQFWQDKNKITVSFVPSSGVLSEQFQIVWLTFTTWDAVDTAAYSGGIQSQRFDDVAQGLGLHSFGTMGTLYGTGGYTRDGIPGAAIRPDKVWSDEVSLQMDVSDAERDYETTYIGRLAFGRHSGNAVLSTFLPGHLFIDPSLVDLSVPSTATRYSGIQRKTFYDGQRYWLFWQHSTTTVSYDSSVDGKNWGAVLTAATATSFPYGFTIINYGSTVGVLWTDSTWPYAIQIRTGLIAEDSIQWDGVSHELYNGNSTGHTIRRPVSATFNSQGTVFVTTWSDTGGGIGTDMYKCTGPSSGFSPCSTWTQVFNGPDWATGNPGGYQYSVVVPFNLEIGSVARIKADSVTILGSGHTYFRVKIFHMTDPPCGDTIDIADAHYDEQDAWMNDGLFTGTAGTQYVSLFYRGGNSGIFHYNIDINCGSTQDTSISETTYTKYLSTGTASDGSIDLFYELWNGAGSSFNVMRHTRIVPKTVTPTPSTILSSYYDPFNLTIAQSYSHFAPLAFTRAHHGGFDSCTNYCLYYVNYPLPSDAEAAVNNPWATKLGAHFVNDVGGVVNPTVGLLANGQTLIAGTPALPIMYREPGLYTWDGTKDVAWGYVSTGNTWDELQGGGYRITTGASGQITIPGMYYDLPWIDGMVHLQGGQKYSLVQTGESGNSRWYNNTKGVRYTLLYDTVASKYTLTLPSGANMTFVSAGAGTNWWDINKVYLDTTGNNWITYSATHGGLGGVADSSGRSITIDSTGLVTYGNGQRITLNALGTPVGCADTTSASQTLQIADTIGRKTTYYICSHKLAKLESPNGGRVNYTYASYGSNQVWQGTETYSLPLTLMDIYNESSASVKARSLGFNWNFQNGEVVRALVNTTDKSAVVQGSNEYIFNSAAGTASVRVYDSAGQTLYYDMETLTSALMKDLSGNANNGTITGTTSLPGLYGQARKFNGGTDIIKSQRPIPTSNYATFVAWVNRDSTQPDANGTIINDDRAGKLELTNAGVVRVEYHDGTYWRVTTSTGTVGAGAWAQVAVTFAYAPTGTVVSIYINGAIDPATPVTRTGYPTASSQPWASIGGDGGTTSRYKGVIDEPRMFRRTLSPEDIGALNTKNALKRGEQQNWYSINDQPHLAEGFVGDDTSASVVTQDAIDDWGNQIYHRDALGNETFASYANTNHQNHFYAPGRLTKTGTSNTEFIDFSNGRFPTGRGVWTVTSTAATPALIDYSTFDKIMPALRLYAPSSGFTTIKHTMLVPSPNFIEFRARTVTDVTNSFEIRFGTASADYAGIRFSGSRTFEVCQGSGCASGTWTYCNPVNVPTFNYELNSWYRITIEVDYSSTNYPWSAFLNGRDLSCGSLTLAGHLLTQMSLSTSIGIASWTGAAIDDIKLYANNNGQTGYGALNIGFAGLQLRQSIRLLAENGSIIDQTMQTVSGTTLWLSFNSALSGAYNSYENGDNAKTMVQIYAEDGTLEYQSPLTRFFVGEQYTYTRPRTFSDELVKMTSGALKWPNGIYADDDCTGITCNTDWPWIWKSSPDVRGAMSGTKVHITPFGYGARWHYFTISATAAPSYFVTYVRIPSGEAPDGLSLAVKDCGSQGNCVGAGVWKEAYWGALLSGNAPDGTFWGIQEYMGPLPAIRDQWIQLIVSTSSSDLWISDYWGGVGYGLAGGQAEWDVTTTQSGASLTVSGLSTVGTGSNNQIEVDYANNDTQIGIGPQIGDSATVVLYNKAMGINSFPIQVKIRVFSYVGGIQEYYFGPLRNVWPGDSFRDVGSSPFFDTWINGVSYWPSDLIHTSLLGSKKFSGDCLDAVACYDMETFTEGTIALNTGVTSVQIIDLSGKGKGGALTGAPKLSVVTKGAAGLATTFDGAADEMQASPSVAGLTSWSISAWVNYDSSGTNTFQHPIAIGTSADATIYVVKANNNINMKTLNNVGGTVVDANMDTLTPGTSMYVVVTFDGTNVRGYTNGVLRSTVSGSTSYIRTNNMMIGAAGDSTNFFKGTVDQVIVYKTMLSATQVLALYQSRMPGSPQTYIRPLQNGLANATRTPYEGTYLYATAQYDNKGNMVSVSDVGRSVNGGKNVTKYAYSTLSGRDYRTQVNRSDGKQIYFAYDFQSGVKYGTLDIDCRRSRTSYDAMGRPTQTSIYDTDASEVLHLDMETAMYNSLKDVSCAGTTDSRNGGTVSVTGTTAKDGVDGASRNFHASTDVISIADSPTLSLTGSFTLSASVRWDTLAQSGGKATIIDKMDSSNRGYLLRVDTATKQLELCIGDGTQHCYWSGTGGTLPSGGIWYHVAVAFSNQLVAAFYINGVNVLQTSTPVTPSDGTSPLNVGKANADATHTWDGSIDEVRVFNAVLNEWADIPNLLRLKYKLLTQSSVAYDDMTANSAWAGYQLADITAYDAISIPRKLFLDMETKKLNTVPGTSDALLEDWSGSGNHVENHGATASTGSSNCKIGACYLFDGSTTYMDGTSTPSLNPAGELSASAWIKVDTSGPTTQTILAKGQNGIDLQYRLYVVNSGGSWYLKVDLETAGGTVHTQSSNAIPTGTLIQVGFSYDVWYGLKVYVNGTSPNEPYGLIFSGPLKVTSLPLRIGHYAGSTGTTDHFKGQIDEVHIFGQSLSSGQMTNLYNGAASEKSHMSKTYRDGLGRTVRSVTMDVFGTKITTVATMGWNDQPIYSYLPSGQYFTYTYDFLGRTLSVQTPGNSTISGISRTIVSEKARMVESVDAVGRKAYVKTDLLGRTVETAVWNVSSLAYGNRTAVTYNALSEVVASQDAKLQTTIVYYNSLGKPKMTVFPDSTDANMRYSLLYYDDNLRAFQTVDVIGRVSVSAYDAIGRVTSFTLKPSLSTVCPTNCYVATYGYDSVHDDLKTIDNGTAKITRGYDSLHRLVAEKLEVPAGTVIGTSGYGYDNAGKVLNITYPVGSAPFPQAIYTYDSLGRPAEVDYGVSPATKYAVLVYDSFGRLGSIYYWKGATNTTLQEKYTYDARDRVTQVKVFSSSQTYMQLDYTSYSRASEIKGIADNMYVNDTGTDGISNPKTVTYSYDGNGRLARFTGPFSPNQGAINNCYDYDQVGNILHWKQTSCTVTNTYTITGWNLLTGLTYNAMSFTYNLAGSMLTKTENSVTTTYSQDFLQQLVKVVSGSNSYTYSYDGLGRRVKTVDPSAISSYFIYMGSRMLYSKVGTAESAFVYVGDKLLLRKDASAAQPSYYHQDISPGNVRLITNYTTLVQVEAKYRYKPFGDILILKGSTQRFQYAQQEYDSANRQYHMGARYQDPVVGRFAQRDPIGPGYSYASNNPISLSDPSGAAATSIGSPWSNFMNWLGSPQGQITLVAVDVGLLALSVPTAGTTDAILAGLLVGAIFVAATYVISGGTATAGDYFGVFLLGFTIGVAIADVYSAFGAEAGELGAGKPSLTRRALADGGSIEGAAGAEGSMTAERAAGIAPRLTANGERLADFPEGTSEFFQRAEATEYRVSTGYKNMDAFEREFGPAGPKMHWHHIVEQNPTNLEEFGPYQLHNPDNLVAIPESVHTQISGIYSRNVVEGLRLRNLVRTWSYEEQWEFGWNILQNVLLGAP